MGLPSAIAIMRRIKLINQQSIILAFNIDLKNN